MGASFALPPSPSLPRGATVEVVRGAKRIRAALEAGREVTYLVFSKEPHELRRPASWRAWWAVGEAFLAQHLGGAAQPFGDDLEAAEVVVAAGAEHVEGLAEATR